MSFLVSMTSEIETNMVGVERVKEYQEIDEEAPLEMPGQDPPPTWPDYGVVRFDNYQTRYREGLDLVLKVSLLWKFKECHCNLKDERVVC